MVVIVTESSTITRTCSAPSVGFKVLLLVGVRQLVGVMQDSSVTTTVGFCMGVVPPSSGREAGWQGVVPPSSGREAGWQGVVSPSSGRVEGLQGVVKEAGFKSGQGGFMTFSMIRICLREVGSGGEQASDPGFIIEVVESEIDEVLAILNSLTIIFGLLFRYLL